MCQVTPFTLPCCRRIYVSVEKLPSCPDDWPRKKCPKELIVQISGYEPKDVQHRNQGICWRCLADRTGKKAWGREEMRTVLDRAFIVEGLEEWSMDERRKRQEQAGLCWHCGADRGCGTCGSEREKFSGEREVLEIKGKRGRGDGDTGKGKGREKRVKVGHAGSLIATLPSASMVSTPSFGQEQIDPALQQHDINSGGCGGESSYDQFTQPILTFNYQPQEVQFQSPMPEFASGAWQYGHGFQSQGISCQNSQHPPIDPGLYQQRREQQVEQKFDRPFCQQQELPPISDFADLNQIDLDSFGEIDDETVDRLLAEHQTEMLSSEEEDRKSVTQTPVASQMGSSLGLAQYLYPPPST